MYVSVQFAVCMYTWVSLRSNYNIVLAMVSSVESLESANCFAGTPERSSIRCTSSDSFFKLHQQKRVNWFNIQGAYQHNKIECLQREIGHFISLTYMNRRVLGEPVLLIFKLAYHIIHNLLLAVIMLELL